MTNEAGILDFCFSFLKKYDLSHLAIESVLSAADQEQSVTLWCVRTASQPADEDVIVTHSLAIRQPVCVY